MRVAVGVKRRDGFFYIFIDALATAAAIADDPRRERRRAALLLSRRCDAVWTSALTVRIYHRLVLAGLLCPAP